MSLVTTYLTVLPEWINHNGHMNVDYLAELFEGDRITITTQLLDWDHKRVHYYHRLFQAKTDKHTAIWFF